MKSGVVRNSVVVYTVSALFFAVANPTVSAQAQTAPTAKAVKKPAENAAQNQNKVAIQVNQNDKAVMDLALNNANNIVEYFKSKGQKVTVELVTYGPGLHMLRDDTSPVKTRVAAMSLQHSNVRFTACANTQANMSKAEGKPVALVSEAKVEPSGVVRLMELQRRGYAYIRP